MRFPEPEELSMRVLPVVFLLSLAAGAEEPAPPKPDTAAEDLVKKVEAKVASAKTVSIALTMVGPAVAELGRGANLRLLNAGVVYADTLSANVALNALFKALFGRPRPYTYGPHANEAPVDDSPERYASFYSGHASAAFASAIAGSYLFAEGNRDRGARVALWATELTLAAATANLRVRAGKHYYSDVVVGALIGSGIGVGMPLLHGAHQVPLPGELIAGASGIAFGCLLSELLPFDGAATARKTGVTLDSVRPLETARGPAGLSLSGTF